MKVDEEGYIWFFTSCNRPYTQCFDRELHVSLDYYQNNSLHITGRAFVENANEYLSHSGIPPKNDQICLYTFIIIKSIQDL